VLTREKEADCKSALYRRFERQACDVCGETVVAGIKRCREVPPLHSSLGVPVSLCEIRPLNFRTKIIPYSELASWRQQFRGRKQFIATNGCFDLLHLGHVTYLETARNLGEFLLVGVNSDGAVRALKGEGRPVNNEHDRAAVLAALQSVDAVCIFPEVRATNFLAAAQPDIYVKGGDYTLETLDQDERGAVEGSGGTITIIPFVAGKSTTGLLKKISA
jgi:D-glycero-beta-D-manno-heptose 1-phosphate adenylyltransferase